MFQPTINLLDELEDISKIHWLTRDDIDVIMLDFARRIVSCLRIERVNIWLFNNNNAELVSIGEYDTRDKILKKNSVLHRNQYPNYFRSLNENRIVLVEDVNVNEYTRELRGEYCKKHDVRSLMDVPIRIGGEMVGVICFEKTGTGRIFMAEEKSFALSVAHVLASNLEARQRRAAQHKLVKLLEEKDLLIREINHRVKNNFSIIISLMRLSRDYGGTTDPKIIFEEYEQRILSMLKIHDLLYETGNYTSVNVTDYIKELLVEFKSSHPELEGRMESTIEKLECLLPTKKAIHIGLILSEILLNAYKYAFKGKRDFKLFVRVSSPLANRVHFFIGDNGPGFDFSECLPKKTLGLNIIRDLLDGLDAEVSYPVKGKAEYQFEIEA